MKNKLIVVKIGGKIIENESLMNRFLKSFSKIKDKKILIHGGGKIVSDFLKKIDIEPKVINISWIQWYLRVFKILTVKSILSNLIWV